VCVRSLAFWDYGFESLLEQGRPSLFNVLFFQVEISATGRFLVQRSRSECGVSECDLGIKQRRFGPIRAVEP
jgi:hypothetical protein